MKSKNKLISILMYVSLVLSIATIIPYSFKGVANYEWIIKFCVFPVVILVVSILSISKRLEKVGDNKYEVLGTMFPVTAYIASAFMFLATIALRAGTGEWVDNLTAYLILIVVFLSISLIILLKRFNDSEKKYGILSSVALYLVLIGQSIYCAFEASKFVGVEISKEYQLVVTLSIVFAAILIIVFFVLLFMAEHKILNEKDDEIYIDDYVSQKMDYLLNLYHFTKEELESYGYEFPKEGEVQIVEVEKEVIKEVEVEKIVEVEKEVIKEVEVEKIVEVIKEVEVEKIVEVEKEPVLIPVVAPKEPKPVKEKKVIEPSVAELAEYITANFPDANIVYGKNESNYKVFRNKKLMLVVQSSANDYKIMFQRKPISVAKLLIKYPNVIIKATNPVGEQWFKVTNKGNVDAEDLKTIIKFSHKYLVDEEAKELAKKEKQKAKIQAKKDAEKAKIKAKKEAEKAKIKAKKEAEKAKLKAKEEAEKAKQKAKEEALKAKEAAKEQAKLEKQKAKEEAKKEQANAKPNGENAE